MIRDSSADVVVAGGTEAFTSVVVAAFARMGALSTRNDEPHLASRPFDADRDGFVMAEGAAFMVLEPLERARARGARVYAEVAGYGRNADAFHITAPSPGGVGAAACMEQAIADAGINAVDIGQVNAHGTSTPMNDSAEADAIRKVFGDGAPPVTGSKGVLGHMVGAAGAVEAVIALLSMTDGIVPPTANTENLGEGIDLDLVTGAEREIATLPVISNSFGFGGHNASLVLTPTA
jgi:3-oxoacyl-[acyl-carrier-protein] synthase II